VSVALSQLAAAEALDCNNEQHSDQTGWSLYQTAGAAVLAPTQIAIANALCIILLLHRVDP
jgi:hypothetical protein